MAETIFHRIFTDKSGTRDRFFIELKYSYHTNEYRLYSNLPFRYLEVLNPGLSELLKNKAQYGHRYVIKSLMELANKAVKDERSLKFCFCPALLDRENRITEIGLQHLKASAYRIVKGGAKLVNGMESPVEAFYLSTYISKAKIYNDPDVEVREITRKIFEKFLLSSQMRNAYIEMYDKLFSFFQLTNYSGEPSFVAGYSLSEQLLIGILERSLVCEI